MTSCWRHDNVSLILCFLWSLMWLWYYQKSLASIQNDRPDAIPIFVILCLHASTLPQWRDLKTEPQRRDIVTKHYLTACHEHQDMYIWLISHEHAFWMNLWQEYGYHDQQARNAANRTKKFRHMIDSFWSRQQLVARQDNQEELTHYCDVQWLDSDLLLYGEWA